MVLFYQQLVYEEKKLDRKIYEHFSNLTGLPVKQLQDNCKIKKYKIQNIFCLCLTWRITR